MRGGQNCSPIGVSLAPEKIVIVEKSVFFLHFSLKRCLYVRWCELPGPQEKNYLDCQSEIESPARNWQNRCHFCPRPPATLVFSRPLHQIELDAAVVYQH